MSHDIWLLQIFPTSAIKHFLWQQGAVYLSKARRRVLLFFPLKLLNYSPCIQCHIHRQETPKTADFKHSEVKLCIYIYIKTPHELKLLNSFFFLLQGHKIAAQSDWLLARLIRVQSGGKPSDCLASQRTIWFILEVETQRVKGWTQKTAFSRGALATRPCLFHERELRDWLEKGPLISPPWTTVKPSTLSWEPW